MFNITQYLQKFSRVGERSILAHKAVSDSIFDICGIENIKFEIKRNVVYIQEQPAIKAAVYVKKEDILNRLSKEAPWANIGDIR